MSVKVTLIFLLLFSGLSVSSAQNQGGGKFFVAKRYKGSYSGKKIGVRGGRRVKKIRKANRNTRNGKHKVRQIKKRRNRNYRSRTHRKYGRKLKSGGSLYGVKKKHRRNKGQFKGKYPKSKRDMIHKFAFAGIVGGALTSRNNSNETGDPSAQLFANYKPGPEFGFIGTYNMSEQLGFEGELRFIPLGKDNYSIRAISLGFNIKYTFKSYGKIKPFVLAGMNYSFSNIKQDPFESDPWVPPTDYWQESQENVEVQEIIYRKPGVALNLIPMIGYKVGIGGEYKLNNQWNLFGSLEYTTSFAKNKGIILEHFPLNKSDFSFMSFTVGLRWKLFKNQTLY